MKPKTKRYLSDLESACKAAREIPACHSVDGPDAKFIGALWEARDRFIEDATRGLPEYELPATASLLAQAQSWPDCEGAWRLPGGQLLVCWVDFTEPEVLSENEYLCRLARRSVEMATFDEDTRKEVLGFFRSRLGR